MPKLIKTTLFAFIACFSFNDVATAHGDDGHSRRSVSRRSGVKPSRFSVGVGISYLDSMESKSPDKVSGSGTNLQVAANSEADGHAEEHGHEHKKNHGLGSPTFNLDLGYRMTSRWSAGIEVGANAKEGVEDPSAGIEYSAPLTRRLTVRPTAAIEAPVSKESQETAKIVALRPSVDLTYRLKRWNLRTSLGATINAYQQTPAEVEPHEAATALSPHGETEEEEHEGTDSHDNELTRYAAGSQISYSITRNLRLGCGFDISRADWRVDAPTWATKATVAEIGYEVDALEFSVAAALRAEDHNVVTPDEPLVRLGAGFVF